MVDSGMERNGRGAFWVRDQPLHTWIFVSSINSPFLVMVKHFMNYFVVSNLSDIITKVFVCGFTCTWTTWRYCFLLQKHILLI